MMNKILFLTFLGCLPLCHGYSAGPPPAACTSMMPNHDGLAAQTTEAPFVISVNTTNYMKGDPIKVTINATSTATPFRGFFIQARGSTGTDAVGSFSIGTDGDIKLMTCPGGSNNAVSHKSSTQKIYKEFVWTNSAGSDVTFQATFVNVKATFWTMVKSGVITEVIGSTTAPQDTTTPQGNGGVTPSQCSFFTLVLLAIALL